MTKKELSQLYYLKKEIKEQQKRLEELETLATSCTAKITGMPHGTGINDKIGKYAAQIADLKTLLNKNIEKCFDELNKINEFINSINDSLIRQIITYRFIYGFSWNKVAHTIGGGNNAECLRKKMYRYLKYH